MTRPRDGERGSIPVETLIVLPVLIALILLLILAGRFALARTAVESAAADAARSASIARTATDARSSATTTAAGTLSNHGVPCRRSDVTVSTAGFSVPVGTPAQVAATVTCDVDLSGLAGLPGGLPQVRVEATMTSPLDTYRGRR